MSQSGSTSIKSLHEKSPQESQQSDGGNNKVVQEILNEIDQSETTNMQQQNQKQQNYTMDENVNQNGFAPQSNEEAMRMQQEMMQQQMMQQQMMQVPNLGKIGDVDTLQKKDEPKSLTNKILEQAKGPIVVAAIFFLLSVVPTKQLLMKVPKAIGETGNITLIGTALLSLVAGILFFVINMGLTKM